jgi:uncharacterized protein (TIGR02118 family)
MLKVLALIKKRPDLSRQAFREHYEERHVPIAKPLLAHLVWYARHHIEEDLHGRVDFDVVTAFGYPSPQAVSDLFVTLSSEAGQAIHEDERNFMEKGSNRFFEVSERPWQADEAGTKSRTQRANEEEERSIFVFVARPPAMAREECSRRLLRDHWPALLDGLEPLRFATVRDAFPMNEVPAPFDGMMQVPDDTKLDLPRFAAKLEREGYRVAAIRTQRFVTEVPA